VFGRGCRGYDLGANVYVICQLAHGLSSASGRLPLCMGELQLSGLELEDRIGAESRGMSTAWAQRSLIAGLLVS